MEEPYLIELQKIGEEEIGFISVAQAFLNVPFGIRRVYWIYGTPETVERGNHAHINTFQLLICLHGELHITLESRERKLYEFVLNDPNKGLFIPTFYWRKLHFSKDGICICLSSSDYDEEDYIREYQEFLNWE